MDNMYAGSVVFDDDGHATVDLDSDFNMTAGTFDALNRDARVLVMGNGCIVKWALEAAILKVTGDATGRCKTRLESLGVTGFGGCLCGAGDEATYVVTAERQDASALDSGYLGKDGNFIPEYIKRDA